MGQQRQTPIKEMQEKSINLCGVRKQLTIDSMEQKIEKRHLIRIGHKLRMDNNRLTTQLVLGWPAPEISDQHRKARQTIIGYWRTLLRNAGQDPDTIESLALNWKKYKKFIEERVRRIRMWENKKADKENTERNQTAEINTSTTCSICGRICKSLTGLKIHVTRMHRKDRDEKQTCERCKKTVATKSALTNHKRKCMTTPATNRRLEEKKNCPMCAVSISTTNLARHIRTIHGMP